MSDQTKEFAGPEVRPRSDASMETSTDGDIREDEDAPADGTGRISFFKDRFVLPTIAGIVALDQFTKLLITSNMDIGSSWPTDGWIRITYGTNTGTAFGLFPNQTMFLLVASVIAIGFLVYFYRTQVPPRLAFRLAVGLQLGGAFGNLIDRVRVGAVTDFVDVGPWPIFNVADSAIVIGIIILAATVLFGGDLGEKPKPADVVPGD